jgi:hypothetical protein
MILLYGYFFQSWIEGSQTEFGNTNRFCPLHPTHRPAPIVVLNIVNIDTFAFEYHRATNNAIQYKGPKTLVVTRMGSTLATHRPTICRLCAFSACSFSFRRHPLLPIESWVALGRFHRQGPATISPLLPPLPPALREPGP